MKIFNRFTGKEILNISGANLREANLREADLCGADLYEANLRGANLREANLRGANLREANLCGADLYGANLREANLRGANLREADLYGANLREADLYGAKGENIENILISHTSILPEGDLIGYKKCINGIIVKIKIPDSAKRSNATGRKCRAEFIEVLEIYGADEAISSHDNKTVYKVGEIVKCDKWDKNRWEECSGGIHFFITKLEAENY